MASMKMDKAILKADFSRKYPDPLNSAESDDAYNMEHHVILCKAVDIPSGISKKPNPREQKIDYGIYKDIQASLEDGGDPTFHLKNKGITLFAHKVDYSDDKRVVTVHLGENDGIADGGHTYEIVLKAQSKGACPDNQYVKFEIITGIPARMMVDITGGLNTAVQVQEASLANLEGKFEWIKDALADTPYRDKVAFKQNEKGDLDIRDILALLTLFNVEQPDLKGRQPREAYTSKSACLSLYQKDQEEMVPTFQKLQPILKDILYLHDYVNLKSRQIYNREKGGAAGKMTGVYEQKKRGKFKFIFMNEEDDMRMYDGALYPILGALRYLVEIKPGEKNYSWKFKKFSDVLSFYDMVAADMVATTYNTSLTYGRKPNAIGKDENHWDNLYKTVALTYLERK